VKYRSPRKCRRKFLHERVPSRQTTHNLVNKLGTLGLLIDKKKKFRVLTGEKLDDIRARLEHTLRKSMKCLARETGVSKSNARMATQLLNLRSYKTTVIHPLQLHDPASRIPFCRWFLQSVVEGEIDMQLTFFLNEAWFHLQRYINTQNNRYWSSQNPHLTHKVPLPPVISWCVMCCKCKRNN
jgi:hypothetical protein